MKKRSYKSTQKTNQLLWRLWVLLCTTMIPMGLAAEDHAHKPRHHHYKLIDMGTFGGPTSGVGEPSFATDSSRDINVREEVGVSATSIPTAATSNGCSSGFVSHAFVWRMGMVIDLGTLAEAANCSTANAINTNGVIAGQSEIAQIDPLLGVNQAHAAQWRDGRITDLGTLSGGYESTAVSINNQGLVVGIATNAISDPLGCLGLGVRCRAVLWRNGLIQDLGTLGGPEAVAYLINERGQIAGAANTNSSPTAACGNFNLAFFSRTTAPFIWEGDKMTDLGTLGGTCSVPLALNNRGQVVGAGTSSGDLAMRAFLWPGADGKMQDLGTLGGSYGQANAINESGEAVGYAGDTLDQAVAFIWKKGVMINLGFLDGDCGSTAQSLNAKGQIVGYSSTECDFTAVRRGVLWEDGSMVDLNTLIPARSGIQVALAESINDRGEIAANGAPSGCDVVETCSHAVLLIPCDENHPGVEGCDYSLVEAAPASMREPNLRVAK